ncbi:TetR/AcrR family transcriptional regulator [Paenibacillus phytohabitans]|jgi:AcrR family transcriptional regulator|uniref:TetR/AcrR family transcriptional regulator n=1 Tax=Paenibacillus phytohabitans TaxID=2654978 RepID=UPI003008AA90
MGTGIKTDRRILRTREAINRAFLELFGEKELEQITINDIAERANVNRGTVYLHYTDKYDLLNRCIEDHLGKMFLSCNMTRTPDGDVGLISEMKPVFLYFEQNFLFFSAMLANQRTTIFRERLLEIVSANVIHKLEMEKSVPEGMDKQLIAHFMASAFVGTVEWWIQNRMPHAPEEMAQQVRSLFEGNTMYRGHQ